MSDPKNYSCVFIDGEDVTLEELEVTGEFYDSLVGDVGDEEELPLQYSEDDHETADYENLLPYEDDAFDYPSWDWDDYDSREE